MYTYGDKRKEKKNKKSVIKTYKATYLRALSAATKDAGGVLSAFLRNKGAAKARTIYSLYTLVGFEDILLEVITAAGNYRWVWLFTRRCPSLCGCLNASNYYDYSSPTKRQRVFTVIN